jgi:hypothetical protein
MNSQLIEVIRENLTTEQVLEIVRQERGKGRLVNVNRLHSQLVEIEILHLRFALELNARPMAKKLIKKI